MQVKQLMKLLRKEDPDAEVLIALGDERYSPLAGFDVGKYTGYDKDDPDDDAGVDEDIWHGPMDPPDSASDGPKVLLFWPADG